jgi:hypothetical protein
MTRGQSLRDRNHVLGRLVRAEYRLGVTLPKDAVMIDPCDADVFVREMPQPLERGRRTDGATGDRFQQLA